MIASIGCLYQFLTRTLKLYLGEHPTDNDSKEDDDKDKS